ncbi:LacI family DNA-binding transcriptional regulator [Peribacillus huizhouensis]|uniref:LacI family transcriptional regulator n=1 Tax=Peribacillus huizhouensis TaxID=1501239 RepID=A0ABR6CU56_9BACI|nr:LacI family DNA-binding transcriptional regulator [Peribacillus huizhouensis]MBA9028451.1 LacI family transcriptional regulator [Peribacillus huizhouensis]
MEKKYTLRDIAQLANVSFKTVSRVINNETGVRKETKEKVLRVLKETNYTMNYYAKGLSQNKTFQILVVSDIDRDNYPVQRTSIIINNIIKEANNEKYKVVLVNNLDELESNYMGVLEKGYYDGMIVLNSPRNNALLEEVEKLGVPVIVSGKNDKFTYVGTDHETGAYLAANYLFKSGMSDIHLLLDNPNWPTHDEKIKGFHKAFLDNHIPFEPNRIITDLSNSTDVFQYVEKHFKNDTLPNGLIISSDFSALGAIKAINKYQIPCPDKVSVIGFGNMPICTEVFPELTSVEQDFERIGQILVQKLVKKLAGEQTTSYKIKTELVVRKSTL